MNESEYIEKRLDDQINWYSNKSSIAQKKYKTLQTIEIIIAASAPVITAINASMAFGCRFLSILVGVIGATVVVIESICKMNKYHENWIQYRSVSELLKQEKHLYLTKTEPYDGDGAFPLLVKKVERAISAENIDWVGINEDKRR